MLPVMTMKRLYDNFPILFGIIVALYILKSVASWIKKPKRISVDAIGWKPPKEISKGWKGTFVEKANNRIEGKPDMIQCFDPATGYSLGQLKAMNETEVKEAVKKARVAQEKWAKTSFDQRRQFLQLLLDFVVTYQQDLAMIAVRDSGKTGVDATFGEILTTCEKLSWTIKHGEKYLKKEYRPVCTLMMHKSARVEYIPLGVMSAIVSWNYPFHNMIGPMISALFAGNACIVKVSELTTWSSRIYESLIQKALIACGHSPDLFQIVTGFAESGQALVDAPVDKLLFIGSPKVGKMVMAAASKHLTPVVLELGGKDPAILCEDCDFGQACNLAMRGTFQSCGQNCIGIERFIVYEQIYDKFVSTMESRVKKLTQGPPSQGIFDTGAMVMPQELNKMEELVNDAVSKGARLLVGGKRNIIEEWKLGSFFQPTLLVDVTPKMRIAQEEVFGPIMVVMKAKDDKHAIELANSCDYGLGSSVFSKNYARAEKIVKELKTGMGNVNDFAVNYLCQSLPFGGVKISGFDRFSGVEGLRGNCIIRAITTDRFPGIRTDIPPLLNYPMGKKSFEFCTQLCSLFYGSLSQMISSAIQLAKLSLSN